MAARSLGCVLSAAEFLADAGSWLLRESGPQRSDHRRSHSCSRHRSSVPASVLSGAVRNGGRDRRLRRSPPRPTASKSRRCRTMRVVVLVASIAEVRPELSSVSGPRDPCSTSRAPGSSDAAARGSCGTTGRSFGSTARRAASRIGTPPPRPGGRLAVAQPLGARLRARDRTRPFDVAAFFRRRLRRRELHVWERRRREDA